MWDKLLDRFLRGFVVSGRLSVTFPDGTCRDYGQDSQLSARIQIHDTQTIRALSLNPELALGEAYMDERVTLQNTTLDDLMRLLIRSRENGIMPAWLTAADRIRLHLRRFLQKNAPGTARRNVAHHYDISDDLYRLFLDEDMQYSCAYFTDPDMSLEAAQAAKKAHIAAKLRLEPGMRVLDMGCGWGGMALTLARDHGVEVTGITLSENQLSRARTRATETGLSDRVHFHLKDYRHIKGPFDRVVSVGMFEHVGLPNYDTYFRRVADLLAPDGIALIHTIGRSAPPIPTSPWITKYIFPGGYVPSLSDVARPIERAGLWQADIEVWRLHYAQTIRHWRARFDAKIDQVEAMYDPRFVRMFRYYLTICIMAFEEQMQGVYQFQLARRNDSVPLTRDYILGLPHPLRTELKHQRPEPAE